MKVLIVDDEHDVQLLFQQRFRKELKSGQLEFRFAFSGDEALHELDKPEAADLARILSDLNMPGMNGLELLKHIKTNRAGIQFFVMTAYGDEKNFQLAMAGGADGYFTKPVDFDELRKRILNERER